MSDEPAAASGIPPVGTLAPDFTLPAHDGSTVHLAELRGTPVILYFYPKDNTTGWTIEAASFRDHWNELQARGVTVLGISPDDIESHIMFAEQQHLPFLLLADVGAEVAQRYGVWVERSMSGRTYMGIARTTFYILPDGTIGHVWEHVNPSGHAAEVLAYLAG